MDTITILRCQPGHCATKAHRMALAILIQGDAK